MALMIIMKQDFTDINRAFRRIASFFTSIMLLINLNGCSYNSKSENISTLNDCMIIEETEYYKITKLDNIYYYTIFKNNGEIAETSKSFPKKPEILVQNNFVRISFQSGTGLSTKWSYYYDVENDRFSSTFYSIFDRYNETIVYGIQNGIMIGDIFDDKINHKKIMDFYKPLSITTEPFIDVKFIKNGTILKVTYLSGDNYQEVTEYFDLI